MKLNFCLVAFAAILFTACSSNEKKIMVISKGKATIDVTGKTIAVKDGAGSEEAEMLYNTADKVVLKVKSEDKEVAIDIPENGYYILNTKNDTLIGIYQNIVKR
jgi:hypothetical protein